ncbi:unnamed protein product [Heterosigma akashiwo]
MVEESLEYSADSIRLPERSTRLETNMSKDRPPTIREEKLLSNESNGADPTTSAPAEAKPPKPSEESPRIEDKNSSEEKDGGPGRETANSGHTAGRPEQQTAELSAGAAGKDRQQELQNNNDEGDLFAVDAAGLQSNGGADDGARGDSGPDTKTKTHIVVVTAASSGDLLVGETIANHSTEQVEEQKEHTDAKGEG